MALVKPAKMAKMALLVRMVRPGFLEMLARSVASTVLTEQMVPMVLMAPTVEMALAAVMVPKGLLAKTPVPVRWQLRRAMLR